MNIFDRWIRDGGHVYSGSGGRVQLSDRGPTVTRDSFIEAQEWLENHYDVPTPARLKAAGWNRDVTGRWQKAGTTVALQDTLAAMEALADAVTLEALAALGWVRISHQRVRWHNTAGCPLHLRLEADGRACISVEDGPFLFAGTEKLSVVKEWMERLK